ncbi:MAG TPA: hypothetical protein ENN13_01855, partial [Candidatus Altiarchaeales archaeon]|nr:hypothetical protein [Candidatus Altiarchaeales archaeon]
METCEIEKIRNIADAVHNAKHDYRTPYQESFIKKAYRRVLGRDYDFTEKGTGIPAAVEADDTAYTTVAEGQIVVGDHVNIGLDQDKKGQTKRKATQEEITAAKKVLVFALKGNQKNKKTGEPFTEEDFAGVNAKTLYETLESEYNKSPKNKELIETRLKKIEQSDDETRKKIARGIQRKLKTPAEEMDSKDWEEINETPEKQQTGKPKTETRETAPTPEQTKETTRGKTSTEKVNAEEITDERLEEFQKRLKET